jgi:hypothetical protein
MSYKKIIAQNPGLFPYTPGQPGIEPVPPGEDPDQNPGEQEPGKKGKRVQGRSKDTVNNVKELGATDVPEVKSNIHCLTIVGQVEGQLSLGKIRKNLVCFY